MAQEFDRKATVIEPEVLDGDLVSSTLPPVDGYNVGLSDIQFFESCLTRDSASPSVVEHLERCLELPESHNLSFTDPDLIDAFRTAAGFKGARIYFSSNHQLNKTIAALERTLEWQDSTAASLIAEAETDDTPNS